MDRLIQKTKILVSWCFVPALPEELVFKARSYRRPALSSLKLCSNEHKEGNRAKRCGAEESGVDLQSTLE